MAVCFFEKKWWYLSFAFFYISSIMSSITFFKNKCGRFLGAALCVFAINACGDDSSGNSSQVNGPSENPSEKGSEISSPSDSENTFINDGWREDCLAKINEYRATENLEPLVLASAEIQACADKQSAADLKDNVAHGHAYECGESAQNSGPNFKAAYHKNATGVAESYLKMMWEDEKAKVTSGERDLANDDDYPYIGHYINMRNTRYTKVACGIALSSDGETGWFNVDFF